MGAIVVGNDVGSRVAGFKVGARVVGTEVGFGENGAGVGSNVPDVVIVHRSARFETFLKASTATCRILPSGKRLASSQASSLPFAKGAHCHRCATRFGENG